MGHPRTPENLPVEAQNTLALREWQSVRANHAAGLVQALDIFARERDVQFRN
jgi:hypothetical protein